MTHEREVIIKTAVNSRLFLILFQYLSNIVVPDHKADAFIYPKANNSGVIDQIITHCLGGFLRWDAQHFMHIARYGYTYEQTLAFFPLYPIIVRYLALTLSYIIPFVNLDSLILLVFISVNILCFILSALCLYELSTYIIGKDAAYKATILFCYNPASIFFLSPYTECVFSYLTFKSMLNCIVLYRKYCDTSNLQFKDIVYIIPICLSTSVRSNGVLNIGFLLYTGICIFCKQIKFRKLFTEKLLYSAKFLILMVFLTIFCVLPFVLFQFYAFKTFCTNFEVDLPHAVLQQSQLENFILPGSFSKHNQSWCFSKIPLAYSYIQSHYWKVGFMQYYELKQIPNFMLAFPAIFIIATGSFQFFKQFPKDFRKWFNFYLINESHKPSKARFSPLMFVYVIHGTILTVFCILNIHIQVTTRMLCSASPLLYWFTFYYIDDISDGNLFSKIISKPCTIKEYLVLCYFLSFFTIGTAMFCNFLPWT